MNYVTYNIDSPNGLRAMIENIHIIAHVSIAVYDPQFHLILASGNCNAEAQTEYWAKKTPELYRNSPNLRLLSDNFAEVAAAVTVGNKEIIAYAIISDFYFNSKANPHIKQFKDGFLLLDEIVIRSVIDMIAHGVRYCLRDIVTVDEKLHGQVDAYINDNLDKKITVRTLSNALNEKQEVLIALFQEELKTTLPKYLSEKRLEQAKKMLESTEMSLAEIATAIGLEEKKFILAFTKYASVSPEQYRQDPRTVIKTRKPV